MTNNFNINKEDQNKAILLIKKGDSFLEQKIYDDALKNYHLSLNFLNELNPDELIEIYRKIGNIYYLKNSYDLAINYYEKYVEFCRTNSSIYSRLGSLYYYYDNEKSLEFYNKAIELTNEELKLTIQCLNILESSYFSKEQICNILKIDNVDFFKEEVLKKKIFQLGIQESSLTGKFLIIIKSPSFNQKEICNIIKTDIDSYRENTIRINDVYAHNKIYKSNKKLNIGYISHNFYTHAVMNFVLPFLENHNIDKFNIFFYSNASTNDYITNRIKKLAYKFEDIHMLTNKETADVIFKDDIDILIDLSSHTHSKIFSLMFKPAPIQMTYMGFLNTSGMKEIDYILADKYTLPEEFQNYYVEKPLYLDKGYECFSFNETDMNLPNIDILPCKKNNYITFGSFNCTSKLNEVLIKTWSEILKRVQNSKLLIYRHHLNEHNIMFLNEMFEKFGIYSNRLTYSNKPFSFENYSMADIALDSFPFGGLTVTIGLIAMGVPSVTLNGKSFQSKSTSRVNKEVGLCGLIAEDKDSYINKAVDLANDLEKLENYRNTLRERLFNSKFFKHKEFTKSVERAYLNAWNEFCASHNKI